MSFFCLLHLWFAGFGMYFLARRWTGNDFAAAFAGVAFAFNGLTLNLLMWPSHIATSSWMPWVVLAVEGAWREGGRKIILAAIAGALQMLAGGPEIIFLTWLFLLALWIQQLAKGESPRARDALAFSAVIVLVIAADGGATAAVSRSGRAFATRGRLCGYALVHARLGLGEFSRADGFWPHPDRRRFLPIRPGLDIVLLSRHRNVLARVAGGLDASANGASAARRGARMVALIFALGENTPVFPPCEKSSRKLSLITYPVKYVLLVTFIAPLLAAFALRQRNLQSEENRPLTSALILVGAILLALIAGILFWAWRFPFPTDDVRATLLNGCPARLSWC